MLECVSACLTGNYSLLTLSCMTGHVLSTTAVAPTLWTDSFEAIAAIEPVLPDPEHPDAPVGFKEVFASDSKVDLFPCVNTFNGMMVESLHPQYAIWMIQVTTGPNWLATVTCSSTYLAGPVEHV